MAEEIPHLTPTDKWSLGRAKQWLRIRVAKGERCPCCGQMAKVYKRTINATMARRLIAHYSRHGLAWGRRDRSEPEADFAKLRYWGLIMEMPMSDDKGISRSSGIWMITNKGVQWLNNQDTVPSHAHIYDGRCLRLSGDPISIINALGARFNYHALMRGEV